MVALGFETLKEIHGAIKDLDRIFMSDSTERIDDILTITKNIDKGQFDREIQDKIILGYREGLLRIYQNTLNELNKDIEIPGGLSDDKEYPKLKTSKIDIPQLSISNKEELIVEDKRNKEE